MLNLVKRSIMLVVVGSIVLAPNALGDSFRVKATGNNNWNPDFKHITRGDRIVWVNPARHNTVHNLKATSNNWNKRVTLSPGERTRKRFKKNGTYKYRCTLHEGMRGVIHVQGA